MDVEWQWWLHAEELEEELNAKKIPPPSHGESSLEHATPLIEVSEEGRTPYEKLEEVLDIVSLHRLGDDLDLRSLCQLRLSSKMLGRVAANMLRTRVQNIELFLSPFTDGCAVMGHPRFFRRPRPNNDVPETSIHFEHGCLVEYVRCADLPLARTEAYLYVAPTESFCWSCEELTLANFGDMPIRKYRGQKLGIYWKPRGPDTPKDKTDVVKLGEVWIEASPAAGKRVCNVHHSRLEFRITRSITRQYHDILVEYEGTVVVDEFHLDLRTLIELCP